MAKTKKHTSGFKSKAEKIAIEYRTKLLLQSYSALCAFKLAAHLDIRVSKATEHLKSIEDIERLSKNNGTDCGWSALTMHNQEGNRIIIYNPFHSIARQQSDVMHELAHIICNHQIKEYKFNISIPLGMRQYDTVQEEEAQYLGAVLQIPRVGLIWAKNRNMNHHQIAQHFNASLDMVIYRANTSGVEKQYQQHIKVG